jgi:hypothetical protein
VTARARYSHLSTWLLGVATGAVLTVAVLTAIGALG